MSTAQSAPEREPAVEPARPLRSIRGWLPAVTAVLVTAWVFRTVLLDGALPGNIGDSRWTIALHEHWYRVLTGQDAVRDLQYYYPLGKTLGTSDAYLAQGVLYSIPRLLGAGMIGSWLVGTIGIFLIGALGVAVLARQLLDSVVLQCAFVALCAASYGVFSGYGHPQLFGMLVVAWIFVGLYDLVGRRHVRRGIALLVVVPPVLGLSSWYPMVFAVIILAVLAGGLLLVSSGAGIARMVRQVALDLWRTLRSVAGVVLAVVFVVLWAAVLWVYLPSRGILPPAGVGDLVAYSPRWSDIWNASIGGGGIWSALYARIQGFGFSNPEQQYGFTPVFFLAFAAAGLWLVRLATVHPVRPDPTVDPSRSPVAVGRNGLVAATLTVVATIALFLMDDRGLGLFRLLWTSVPGVESIRAPFRVMTLVFGIALFVIVRLIELTWRDLGPQARPAWQRVAFVTGSGALLLLILVEMQRPPETNWTADQWLPPALAAQVDTIRAECDAFVLTSDDPAEPAWLTPINAVVLSTETGVPTPQGYSRADPLDYPVAGSGAEGYAQWLRQHGFDGRVCEVSAQGIGPL